MAGAGYKLFNTGDVLTAAQVNTYLMEQTVMVFADAAARTTALTGVVSEGMLSYLKDTNAVEVYNGSAWVSSDDPNAIQNTIVDAKGDLITATAADTPARLAAGNNGETLVADSATSTGLRYQATKSTQQAIINGGMDIWQRGTSFAYNNQSAYSADRWYVYSPNTAATITRQAGTGEFQYLMRLARNNATSNTGVIQCNQTVAIDEATQFAGKTVTLSFYARAGANFSAASSAISVSFISGTGSTDVNRSNSAFASGDTTVLNTTQVITSTLTRYSFSFTLGATVTQFATFFGFTPVGTAGANDYFEITGVQLEVGSVATTFRRAGGTLQGELALAQRYYFRNTADQVYGSMATGFATSSTGGLLFLQMPVQMRVTPTALEYANLRCLDSGFAGTLTSLSLTTNECSKTVAEIALTGTGYTTHRPIWLSANNNAAGYVAVTAEL